jgi:glucan phosphoethanolaminetransferase (alkaline phosphatase superfamily)
MPRIVPILMLAALSVLLTVCVLFGVAAVAYSATLSLCFAIFFGAILWGSVIQSEANPGIENIEDPSFWWSRIYMAWLYVTDTETWAAYACLFSCLFATLFGSLFGTLVLYETGNLQIAWVSWSSGMFLMVALALFVATSDTWTSNREPGKTGYEEVEPLLRAKSHVNQFLQQNPLKTRSTHILQHLKDTDLNIRCPF